MYVVLCFITIIRMYYLLRIHWFVMFMCMIGKNLDDKNRLSRWRVLKFYENYYFCSM